MGWDSQGVVLLPLAMSTLVVVARRVDSFGTTVFPIKDSFAGGVGFLCIASGVLESDISILTSLWDESKLCIVKGTRCAWGI